MNRIRALFIGSLFRLKQGSKKGMLKGMSVERPIAHITTPSDSRKCYALSNLPGTNYTGLREFAMEYSFRKVTAAASFFGQIGSRPFRSKSPIIMLIPVPKPQFQHPFRLLISSMQLRRIGHYDHPCKTRSNSTVASFQTVLNICPTESSCNNTNNIGTTTTYHHY